jgi:predicted CxxxxCH...CXXCH cytochrome family protein
MRCWLLLMGFMLAGCSSTVVVGPSGDDDDDNSTRFHALDYAQPAIHGSDLKIQALDCRGCHGAELSGGTGPSCDSCHPAGWRTDCVFCHGGDNDATGAPPTGLHPQPPAFAVHTAHVDAQWAAGLDCDTCHARPSDVLTPDHIFDDTPDHAEVLLTGLASGASYDPTTGDCSSLYCHGNGQSPGAVAAADSMTCASCHPSNASGNGAWNTMSGEHARHIGESTTDCVHCHEGVVGADGQSLVAPALHVDGQVQTQFDGTVTYDGTTCDGACHGQNHNGDDW